MKTGILLLIAFTAVTSISNADEYSELKFKVTEVDQKKLFVAESDSCKTVNLDLGKTHLYARSFQKKISVCKVGSTPYYYGFYNKQTNGHPDGECGRSGVEQDIVIGSLVREEFKVSIDRIISSCFCNDSLPKLGIKIGKRIALRNEVNIKMQTVPLIRFKKNSKYMTGPVVIRSEYKLDGKIVSERLDLGKTAVITSPLVEP